MARFYFVWLVHFGNVLNQLFVFNNVWLQTPQRVFAVVTSRHIAAKFQSATERARKSSLRRDPFRRNTFFHSSEWSKHAQEPKLILVRS